jgi:hypothetical protein
LQVDGCAGFDQIYEAGRIQEAACRAHVRRKYYDLEVAHKSPVAAEALQCIAGLYALEKEIRGRPPDERRFEETLGKLSGKSDTAMAVRYALGRGERCYVSVMTAASKSIIMQRNERCGPWLWAERTFFLRAPMVVERVPRRFTACSVRPN